MQSVKPNRLALEASPYLLQHAHNPVDWYPWCAEALGRAAREDKPILLSVGYSACHWCHVMEKESFLDPRVAEVMNERFVNIKVDREERPDIDQIYQLVVQLMGRNGGWPLTVFLTPDQKPFFGGTYFPPVPRYGMPSFTELLLAVSEAYREKREDVVLQAEQLARAIGDAGASASRAAESIDLEAIGHAVGKLARRFDDVHGGFGGRPKFPNTIALDLLSLHGHRERFRQALDSMRAGGIHDQLGGGFHRYSTDERWLVPHFEKMLYDNALLLRLYADGHRAFGGEAYAETARGIVGWAFREMSHESGMFFATLDADSEGHEGKFFLWTPEQVREALAGDAEAAQAALESYGITDEGNFWEPGSEATGESVLHLARSPSSPAALERARSAMFAARERRPKPFRDEKLMTSLNALFIGALANAGGALREDGWIERARRAFDALWSLLGQAEGNVQLGRYSKEGRVVGSGFLDDYAYLASAALALYEATGDARLVVRARLLVDAIVQRFHDARGGFFLSPSDGEALIHRSKDAYDHAVPAGAAVAARAMLRLGTLQGDSTLRALGETEVLRLAAAALDNPFAYGSTLMNLDELARGRVDVVIVTRGPAHSELVRVALRADLAHRNVVRADLAEPPSLAACAGLLEGKEALGAYLCRGTTCSAPVSTPEALSELLALARTAQFAAGRDPNRAPPRTSDA